MAKKNKLTEEHVEQMLDALDDIYDKLWEAGHREIANTILGLQEELDELVSG